MSSLQSSHTQFSLTPLGAGDLIDRAVRLYRKNFWTFVLIAAPPVVIGTLFSIGWTMLGRQLFFVGNTYNPDDMFSYQLFTWFGGMVIWFVETIFVLTVMGGASRNFIRHLIFNEPITFRDTYSNTRKRFFGLLIASITIAVVLGIFGLTLFYFALIAASIIIIGIVYVMQTVPTIALILSVIAGLIATLVALWLFFLVASRFAYVPQVMLVEGKSFFGALSRSLSLASGNLKRFSVLFIFTTVVTYSALALLYIPLGWYAWASGIEVFFATDVIPAWYQIANQMIGQFSLILLMPVWMIGLCLLYVDERVRHEGYDIELMAARRLGDIPDVPTNYVNPLQPALSKTTAVEAVPVNVTRSENITTLGLK
ncbi:MAG: hypothetical protein KIS76_19645 [Pyrinomonadaceae bacterium]|nr:hypothetical protein [Pyrinomonadaceae bacterium]